MKWTRAREGGTVENTVRLYRRWPWHCVQTSLHGLHNSMWGNVAAVHAVGPSCGPVATWPFIRCDGCECVMERAGWLSPNVVARVYVPIQAVVFPYVGVRSGGGAGVLQRGAVGPGLS